MILESTTPGDTVCGYLPVGSEPGSVRLLDALVDQGRRVLLPVTDTDHDGQPRALRWGVYRAGELAGARYGLLEPAGPSLDPSVIAESRVIVVPALAVQHDGARLGRGAGFYDRSLSLADPSALLVSMRGQSARPRSRALITSRLTAAMAVNGMDSGHTWAHSP